MLIFRLIFCGFDHFFVPIYISLKESTDQVEALYGHERVISLSFCMPLFQSSCSMSIFNLGAKSPGVAPWVMGV
jgi:hypothetical protein